MSEELRGRVALVTGGARGVGAAIARALWDHGASVVIADNGTGIDGRGEDAAVARDFVASLGERAESFTEDLAAPGAPARAVDLARSAFGGIDILVNDAAIMRDAFAFKGEPADFDAVVQTNLGAAFAAIRQATAAMREQAKAGRGGAHYRWGRIVNIVSTAGLYGNFGQSAYASSKAGLFGLTRVVAHDMARSGIAVNAVAPFAATRVTESIVPQNDAQAAYKAQALTVRAEHVGRFVAFLASDEGEKITGQLFGVRGREAFVFSQPRPLARLAVVPGSSIQDLAEQVRRELGSQFTPLETDLDAFATSPIV